MNENILKKTVVALLIFFPPLIAIVILIYGHINPEYIKSANDEYRHITTIEDIKNSPITESPNRINEYIDDNIPFRNEINREIARAETAINLSANDDVIIGKDGWLFLTDSIKWHTAEALSDTSGTYGFSGISVISGISVTSGIYASSSSQELNIISDNLLKLKSRLQEKNTELVLYIVPDKVSIYPEYLPDSFNNYEYIPDSVKNYECLTDSINEQPAEDSFLSETTTDKLVDILTENGIKVCFYKDEIRSYKDRFQLYSKSDTHWLSTAAYISTRNLVRELGSDNPPIEELTMFPKDYEGNDLARLLNMADYYPKETDHDFAGYGMGRSMPQLLSWDANGDAKCYHTDGATKLNIYVLHDSFFESMEPFFTIAFSDIYIRHFDNYPDGEIESGTYDVVLLEVCERSLTRFLTELK